MIYHDKYINQSTQLVAFKTIPGWLIHIYYTEKDWGKAWYIIIAIYNSQKNP